MRGGGGRGSEPVDAARALQSGVQGERGGWERRDRGSSRVENAWRAGEGLAAPERGLVMRGFPQGGVRGRAAAPSPNPTALAVARAAPAGQSLVNPLPLLLLRQRPGGALALAEGEGEAGAAGPGGSKEARRSRRWQFLAPNVVG